MDVDIKETREWLAYKGGVLSGIENRPMSSTPLLTEFDEEPSVDDHLHALQVCRQLIKRVK